MKKLAIVLILLMALQPVFAYDVSECKDNNNFSGIGNCILQGSFGGDPTFFSIIFIGLFAIMMWQAKAPSGITLGLGLIMFFALNSGMLGPYYTVLINLTILAIGVLTGLAIIHFVRR